VMAARARTRKVRLPSWEGEVVLVTRKDKEKGQRREGTHNHCCCWKKVGERNLKL
jgi:hypothetical protein